MWFSGQTPPKHKKQPSEFVSNTNTLKVCGFPVVPKRDTQMPCSPPAKTAKTAKPAVPLGTAVGVVWEAAIPGLVSRRRDPRNPGILMGWFRGTFFGGTCGFVWGGVNQVKTPMSVSWKFSL